MLRLICDSNWDVGCILEQGCTGFADAAGATTANIDYMRKVLDA